jgi:hypothetical protein
VTDKVTATTIMFRFVAPTNTGGLPIESYAVEYKETTQQWQDARGQRYKTFLSVIYGFS